MRRMIPDMSAYTGEQWMKMSHEERMAAIEKAKEEEAQGDESVWLDEGVAHVELEMTDADVFGEFKRSAAKAKVDEVWLAYVEEVIAEGEPSAYQAMGPEAVMRDFFTWCETQYGGGV